MDWYLASFISFSMPAFSKFLTGQRGSQQLLDSDGYIYCRKKPRDTALSTAWRCRKFQKPTSCPCHAFLSIADNSISLGSKPHNHDPNSAIPERREIISSLKRKAADQQLSVTQNLISEAIAEATPDVNRDLPKMESLSRVVQRSRAEASGSATHPEAPKSDNFILPPTCTSRDESFVLYDGHTDRDIRVVVFATARNIETLSRYPDWICDGTFYIAPKIFSQSYTIHAVIDYKCVPLVYILSGDKKGDTYAHVLNVIKYYFEHLLSILYI